MQMLIGQKRVRDTDDWIGTNSLSKKTLYTYELLQSICAERSIELSKACLSMLQSNKINRDVILEGTCTANECTQMFRKTFHRLYAFNSYCAFHAKECGKDKMKATNVERYGVENVFSADTIKQKIKENRDIDYFKQRMRQSTREKYGVNSVFELAHVREKIFKTNIEKYGVPYPIQSTDVKERSRQSFKNKWGVENPMQCPVLRGKIAKTNVEKYGYEHPMQNAAIFEKCKKSCFKLHDFKLPSGKVIQLQGYEHFAMHELLFKYKYEEEDIKTHSSEIPEVYWHDTETNIRRRYYIDIFVQSIGLGIEVKSEYTYSAKTREIHEKQESFKKAGYRCEIWVFNKSGEKVLTCP